MSDTKSNPQGEKKTELAFGRIPAFCKYELFMERYRSASAIIRRELPLSEETKYLDVGCGNGYMKYFFDPHEGSEWHGVECWEERIRCCQKLGYQVANVNLEKDAFPFGDGYFDVVIASHVIEHLPDPGKALRECARVLQDGGLLLVATPTKPPGIANLLNTYHSMRQKDVGQTQQAFSARSLKSMVLRELGATGSDSWRVVDFRGLRILSCRKRFKLENRRWFYLINRAIAKHAIDFVPEVNLILRKNVHPA